MAAKFVRLHRFKGVALAGVPVIAGGNILAEGKSSKTTAISELPIYENPSDKKSYDYVNEYGKLHETLQIYVSPVRQLSCTAMKACEGTFSKISDVYGIGKAHTADTVQRLRELETESIAVTSLGAAFGAALAIFRKRGKYTIVASAVLFGTASTALYNSVETVRICTDIYNKVIKMTGSSEDKSKETKSDGKSDS